MLCFESKEEMLGMLDEGKTWLGEWFHWVKPWSPDLISDERFIWIKVDNLPLHAWNPAFLKKIGDYWGQFITINDSTMRKK